MKFIENPQHIYECTYPPYVDYHYHYPHPDHPIITCMDGGILIMNHDEWEINRTKDGQLTATKNDDNMSLKEWESYWGRKSCGVGSTIRLGVKHTFVYECYHGRSFGRNFRVNFLNHNPYDMRKCNLVSTLEMPANRNNKLKNLWNAEQEKFLRRSWEIMQGIIKKRGYNFEDTREYINDLALPSFYANRFIKYAKRFDFGE